MQFQSRWLASALIIAGLSFQLYAVDGVILIDQNRALVGNVTPGDTPGFPVTISLPGSYRLTGNLTVPDANTTAIQLTADNVAIDLNGFSIIGPTVCGFSLAGCSPIGQGVGVGGARAFITVVNGGIRGMGRFAVQISYGALVKNVHATSNGSTGFDGGSDGIVSDNRVSYNGGSGILVGAGSVVSGNVATFNRGFGFNIPCPSSVVGNAANGNLNANLNTSGGGCSLANNAAP